MYTWSITAVDPITGPVTSTGYLKATAIVPEPISSTLFIVGGATFGFRRFRKKFRK
jgi:hypothetical protein